MAENSGLERKKIPSWLKRGLIDTEKTRKVRKLLKELKLNTVCEGARCPNKGECYAKNVATFMILGDSCTRNCLFCAVKHENNLNLDVNEPENLAKAVKDLGLTYVVITSVTRDDLPDGGAGHFADTIREIHKLALNTGIEILVPDFKGNKPAVEKVLNAGINVFNHNVETIKTLYSRVRPQADYYRSLEIIRYAKEYKPETITKSGFMVGLGEEVEEIKVLLGELAEHKCDIVTIGQYMQPTRQSVPVEKYYELEEFASLEELGKQMGLKMVVSGPLVRSSYNAAKLYQQLLTFFD